MATQKGTQKFTKSRTPPNRKKHIEVMQAQLSNQVPAPVGQRGYSTEEAAKKFNVQPATLRYALSVRGSYFGIRPNKLPNRFLVWPADQVDALAAGVDIA